MINLSSYSGLSTFINAITKHLDLMAIIETYKKLREMSIDDLVKLYDRTAISSDVGVAFIREEIARREAEKQTREIMRATKTMRTLTWVITGLTAVNVVLVALTL